MRRRLLRDALLVAGMGMVVAALYLLAGAAWSLLAAGVLAVVTGLSYDPDGAR